MIYSLYLLLATVPQFTAAVTTTEVLCKPRLSEVCGVLPNSLASDMYHSAFVTPNILMIHVSESLTLKAFHSRLDCTRKLKAFHCGLLLFLFAHLFEFFLFVCCFGLCFGRMIDFFFAWVGFFVGLFVWVFLF